MVRSKKRLLESETQESKEIALSKNLDPALSKELKNFVRDLKQRHKLDTEKIQQLFNKELVKEDILKEAADSVPVAIFDNPNLSALEAIVKYLKEELDYSFKEIANLLNRSDKTIWTTYRNSTKKQPERFDLEKEVIGIEELQVEESKAFRLANNQAIRSFKELLKSIELMDDDVFKKYVSKQKNDFCNWIQDVLADKDLANKLSTAETVKEFLKIAKKEISRKKLKRSLLRISIPLSIFHKRKLSVLESIVGYLKEKENLTYHQIAILLNRDDRTIWTVYNRAKKKK